MPSSSSSSSQSSESQSSQSSQSSTSQGDAASSTAPETSSQSSETCTRGIRLRRFAQARYVANSVDGFRFKVRAYGACDMPNEIFLYQRKPYDLTTGAEADVFTSVCSPIDIEEYPSGAPDGTPAFFRQAVIDLVFRSQRTADDAWAKIKMDVRNLVAALDYMDELEVTDDVVYGSPLAADPPTE